MIELENSQNILDRQKYAQFLKSAIENVETGIKILQESGDTELVEKFLPKEKEYLKQLKIKLSNYDIYNQKTPYREEKRCETCRQEECICEEAGLK